MAETRARDGSAIHDGGVFDPTGCPRGRTDCQALARSNLANHVVMHHDDGTITVSPSIKVDGGAGATWHGFLENGVWREC